MAEQAIAQRRSNFKDITGKRFGKLTVLAIGELRRFRCGQQKQYWRCVCECGSVKEVSRQHLKLRGGTRSCGKCARFIDRAGRRYGRLVVVQHMGRRPSGTHFKTWWCCRCDCGRELDVTASSLVSGNTRSCGCLNDEMRATAHITHGMSGGIRGARSPEYSAWAMMIARCTNPKNGQWHNYGARGIKVAEEWRRDFAAFLAHVGRRPTAEYSLDRINNEGNYEPGNVRWATASVQCRNRRTLTHCKRGHLFTQDTTVMRQSNGRFYRRCRICERRGVAIASRAKTDPFGVVKDFEAELAEYTGARFVVTTTSCTAALLLALLWFKRKCGPQTVSFPRFTYVGVGMSVLNAGHQIAFRDERWSGEYKLEPFDLYDSARRLTSGMFRPRAMQTLSFHWTKHLAIQQGGAILHDDPEADQWLRRARFDGRREGVHPRDDVFDMVGLHCYMAGATAAEGLMRLSVLPRHNADLANSDYSDLSLAPIFRSGKAKRTLAVAAE